MRCVSFVSFAFTINDAVCRSVKPSRGLRQGDPLSPYLFLLCAEGLSSTINSTLLENSLSGFRCKIPGPNISHFYFTDDSLLFSNASDYECMLIRQLLDDYLNASGQVINFDKLVMCFSKNVSWAEGDRLANLVGVKHVKCHERYLGLPSLNCKNKRKLVTGIKYRIRAKIDGWKGRLLSIGGREVLLNAVVQAIPTYIMGLFKLPMSFIGDIHKLCNKFLWGSSEEKSKIHWCDWRNMCFSKEEKGLGFRDLKIFNRALLTKQYWRLMKNLDSLAGKVLKSCYFSDSNFLDAKPKTKGSIIGQSLL
ncbi:hypothetical protein Ddye_027116 [Dipteronia dyeriana]|uniref:Reverse transcriptase domain-containing protein n=1 Tax=Dipteronia dyeriana TaxID=168575 RepID=A0AAD9TP55_9ROSI|nr:hypothetical protein Ddye_027116 [Dipteronia dyeriana]